MATVWATVGYSSHTEKRTLPLATSSPSSVLFPKQAEGVAFCSVNGRVPRAVLLRPAQEHVFLGSGLATSTGFSHLDKNSKRVAESKCPYFIPPHTAELWES